MSDSKAHGAQKRLSEFDNYALAEKYSDLKITCGEGDEYQEFKASKAVVCPRSKFFEKVCNGEFKEATRGVVNLVDEKPKVVEMFLIAIYGSIASVQSNGVYAYSNETSIEARGEEIAGKILIDCQVLQMADKYDSFYVLEMLQGSLERTAKYFEYGNNRVVWDHTTSSSKIIEAVEIAYELRGSYDKLWPLFLESYIFNRFYNRNAFATLFETPLWKDFLVRNPDLCHEFFMFSLRKR